MSSAFTGLSSLRAKEEKDTGPKPPSEESKHLQNYLAQQYGAGPGATSTKPKKKKKAKKEHHQSDASVRIVDTDVTGFASPSDKNHRRQDEDDEDRPVIANPEEAEMLHRQAQQEQQLLTKGGLSSWEAVEDVPTLSNKRHERNSPENDDASPPRRRKAARHDSSSDGGGGGGGSDGDASPPRRRARHDSPEDASPPRRRRRRRRSGGETNNDNYNVDGGGAAVSDASPPRRGSRARHDSSSDGDASPPRRRRPVDDNDGNDNDNGANAATTTTTTTAAADGSGRKFMSDGTTAGMVSGRDIQAEMARKKATEARRFATLEADVTGRGAVTVYRDKTGQKLSKEEYVEAKDAERRAGKAQYDDESQLAWGGGLRQKAEREAAEQRMKEEAAKPFARGYDEGFDAEQRGRARWGDPMAHLVKNKTLLLPPPGDSLLTGANQEALKQSGFVIPLEVPQHSWLRRGVGPPPNRYEIKPGRHWDGVDRSNGFERDFFKRNIELKRREQQARMWAQEDM